MSKENPLTSGSSTDRIINSPADLVEKYGIFTVEDTPCQHNALRAWLQICAKERFKNQEQHPQIWQMDTEKGLHAYLVWELNVYNSGVTFPDNTYPDVSLSRLKKEGKDVTSIILSYVHAGFLYEVARSRRLEVEQLSEMLSDETYSLFEVFDLTMLGMEQEDARATFNAYLDYIYPLDDDSK